MASAHACVCSVIIVALRAFRIAEEFVCFVYPAGEADELLHWWGWVPVHVLRHLQNAIFLLLDEPLAVRGDQVVDVEQLPFDRWVESVSACDGLSCEVFQAHEWHEPTAPEWSASYHVNG